MKQFIFLNTDLGSQALARFSVSRPYSISESVVADVFRVAVFEPSRVELTEICIHYPPIGDPIASGAELLCNWRDYTTVSEWLACNQFTDPVWIRWAVPIMQVLYAMKTAFPEIRSFSYTVDEEAGLFFRFSKENIY